MRMRLIDAWDLEARLRANAAKLDTTIYTAPADQINGLYRQFTILIRHLPIIDAVPVVRCKDCKWWKVSEHLAPNCFCFRLMGNDGRPVGYNFSEEDYCSYGEREDDDVERRSDNR